MGVIWNKIWHDFWGNKGRTIQIVLIVAVGAFADRHDHQRQEFDGRWYGPLW